MKSFLAVGVAASALVCSQAFVPPSSPAARQFALGSTATDFKGTVKWYNAERGYGFIQVDGGGPDMYVHATGLSFEGPLLENDRVSFWTEVDKRTNKPKAIDVERIAAEEVEEVIEITDEAPVQEDPVEEAPAKITPTVFAVPKKKKLPVATPPDETFQRALLESQISNTATTEVVSPITPTVFPVPVKNKLPVATPPDEAFQRALLEAQLANSAEPPFQSVDYDSAARLAFEAAGESGDFEAFKAKYLEDASAMSGQKHKARAEAEAAEATAKAEAAEAARLAKEAEEKRLAEEAAAKEAAETDARELGYPSVAMMKARQQPKSAEEEAALASKYGVMDLEERAFNILADLGIIELHPDPEDPNRDTSKDDEDME